MIISNFVLRQLGYNVTVVRGDLPLPSTVDTIIIPSAVITLPEIDNFSNWVQMGGNLIWNGMMKTSFGYNTVDLIGAIQVDNRYPSSSILNVFNSSFIFNVFLDGTKIEYSPTTAQVIGYDTDTIPICFWNKWGKGNVIVCVPAIEQGWAENTMTERDNWSSWYSNILKLVGR